MTTAAACNTHAAMSPFTYGIDWYAGTRRESSPKAACAWLEKTLQALRVNRADAENWQGFRGFKIADGHGFAGIRDSIALISLPGQALECLNRAMTDDEILSCFTGWKATRIDLALDTTSPAVSLKKILLYRKRKLIRCVARMQGDNIEKCGGRESRTVYFGSKKSQRFLRVYDRAVLDECFHGIRFELQHRHDTAEEVQHHLTQNGVKSGRGLLAGFITFHSVSGRKRICRRKPARWWKELVASKKTYLSLDPRLSNPKKTLDWVFSRGFTRALALVLRFGQGPKLKRAIMEAEPTQAQLQKWRTEFPNLEDATNIKKETYR